MSARLVPFAFHDPAFNMAADEAILRLSNAPTLRFYGWEPPAISLGRFQPGRADLLPLLASGLPVVRRMTGGGAIVHAHELTWSLMLPLGHPLIAGVAARGSYAVLHAPFRRALARLGVASAAREAPDPDGPHPLLCFDRATSLDLVAGGRKLLGSAQRRTGGRLLHHGSLILEVHRLQPGTASVSELCGRRVAQEEVAALVALEFEPLLGPFTIGDLTCEELALAADLAPSYRFA